MEILEILVSLAAFFGPVYIWLNCIDKRVRKLEVQDGKFHSESR